MKLLWIIPYTPTPIRTRPYHFLRFLARRGHQVTLATLWEGEAERAALDEIERWGVRVISFPLERLRVAGNLIRAGATGLPMQARYSWDARLDASIQTVLQDEPDFEAVHVEHLRGAVYGSAVLARQNIPVIWDSVDCISNLFAQSARHSQSLFGRWVGRLELRRTRRYEAHLVHRFPRVLVTSSVDRDALLGLGAGSPGAAHPQIEALLNGVDAELFYPIDERFQPDTIVFSGKMSYHANVTAISKFAQNVMPLVWAARPDVKLWIVGKDPDPQVRRLAADSRVQVMGTVPEMRTFLGRAAVSVAPIAYGTGIQNKVLEAMACRTPVVASPQAVMALQTRPGLDVLVAGEPADFAAAILKVLSDPDFRDTVGDAGYAYVRAQHNWDKLTARLEDVYHEAINAAR